MSSAEFKVSVPMGELSGAASDLVARWGDPSGWTWRTFFDMWDEWSLLDEPFVEFLGMSAGHHVNEGSGVVTEGEFLGVAEVSE